VRSKVLISTLDGGASNSVKESSIARFKPVPGVAACSYAFKFSTGAAACAAQPRYVKGSLTRLNVLIRFLWQTAPHIIIRSRGTPRFKFTLGVAAAPASPRYAVVKDRPLFQFYRRLQGVKKSKVRWLSPRGPCSRLQINYSAGQQFLDSKGAGRAERFPALVCRGTGGRAPRY
jgi:hypothetical protein